VDRGFAAIVMGRVEVGFFPDGEETMLAGAERFVRTVGGGGGGVAIAAARLGLRCALISRIGDDLLGEHARAVLDGAGLAHLWLGAEPGLRTPVVFHEAHPAWGPYAFYGGDPAGQLTLDDLDLDTISAARLLWTTGAGVAKDPERAATLAALDARSNVEGGITVHRLDLRPELFGGDAENARECNREALRHATVAVGGSRDARVLTGLEDPLDASAALVDMGLDLVVLRRDSRRTLACTAEGTAEVSLVERTEDVGVDGAFGGALCYALVSGWDTERSLRYAGAACTLASSHPRGEMPTLNDVESLLARSPANL
jgi:5-dehydro-2-deoxygluconokinase